MSRGPWTVAVLPLQRQSRRVLQSRSVPSASLISRDSSAIRGTLCQRLEVCAGMADRRAGPHGRGGGAAGRGRGGGTAAPGPRGALDRDVGREGGASAVYNALAAHSISMQRRLLPIYECRTALLYAVETHGVVVVVGETGCGKSTREW
jgi:HrpA-like RNA helicase